MPERSGRMQQPSTLDHQRGKRGVVLWTRSTTDRVGYVNRHLSAACIASENSRTDFGGMLPLPEDAIDPS